MANKMSMVKNRSKSLHHILGLEPRIQKGMVRSGWLHPEGTLGKAALIKLYFRGATGIKTCILEYYLVIQNKDEILICNNFC